MITANDFSSTITPCDEATAAFVDMYGHQPESLDKVFDDLCAMLGKLVRHPEVSDEMADIIGGWLPSLERRMTNPADRRGMAATYIHECGHTVLLGAAIAGNNGELK